MLSVCAKPSRSKGVALVSVLLVFALASMLAVQLVQLSRKNTMSFVTFKNARQAFWYAQGGETLAKQLLAEDWLNDKRAGVHSDGFPDSWARSVAPYEIDEGEILIKINDLSGFLDLNSVTWEGEEQVLVERLIQAAGLPEKVFIGLSNHYRSKETPAKVESQAGVDTLYGIEQLMDVMPLSKPQLKLLQQQFVILPAAGTEPKKIVVNINTATKALLSALGLEESDVAEISRRQKYKKYQTNISVSGSFPNVNSSNIGVQSYYFEILVAASYAGQKSYLKSLAYRDDNGKVHILKRELSKAAVKPLLLERNAT